MRIYPAVHYTMGGLWVDYNLMSERPRPVRAGRGELLRPRRQPPRRRRAHAGPGRRLFHRALHDRQLSSRSSANQVEVATDQPSSKRPRPTSRSRIKTLLASTASAPRQSFHRELGKLHVGKMRHGAQREGPEGSAANTSRRCARSSGRTSKSPAPTRSSTSNLEHAGRVADSWNSANSCARDALTREESCGGHFREEYQTEDGEAKRDDENFATSPPGNIRAPTSRRFAKEPLVWEASIRPRGATSDDRCSFPTVERRSKPVLAIGYDPDREQSSHGSTEWTTDISRDGHEFYLASLAAERSHQPRQAGDLPGRRTSAPTCRSWRCWTSSTKSSIAKGEEPIAFDHDCREGICGTCSMVINGLAHGPERGTTACQLHMRHFHDGETIVIEPWRARPFPSSGIW